MCISSFFSKSRLATTFGSLIFLASYFVYFAAKTDDTSAQTTAICMSSPACFGFGAVQISTFETAGIGIQFYNLNQLVLFCAVFD